MSTPSSKSDMGRVVDNGNSSGNPQIKVDASCASLRYCESSGSKYPSEGDGGYEGPGTGSVKKLNSDDQMPPMRG